MTIPPTVVGALAAVVHGIRPAWDTAGVAAALRPLAEYDLADLARAAVDAATTPSTMTPAGIGARVRDGWMDGKSSTGTAATPGPRIWPRCPRCRFEVTEGHADHAEHCGRPRLGIPEPARQAALAGIRRAATKRRADELAASAKAATPATNAKLIDKRGVPHTPTPQNPHSGSHGEREGS